MSQSKQNFVVQKWVTALSVILFVLKITAYYLTDSLAILSDALESIVNIVAGFIGSPSMNFVDGHLQSGRFVSEAVKVENVEIRHQGAAKLGFRWEDAEIVPAGQGHLQAEIYAVELIGESTQVTLKVGVDRVVVRAHKDYSANDGELVGLQLHQSGCFFFDSKSGARLRA